MIHRALLGSLERFFGILIEHYKGDFPLWLVKDQAVILPISDNNLEYSKKVNGELKKAGVRSHVDTRNESLGYKVRQAKLDKTPYYLVIGDREEDEGKVKPTGKKEGNLKAMSVKEFVEVFNKRFQGEL